MCFQKEEYWCGTESHRGAEKRRRTPSRPTTTFIQRRKAWPRSIAPTSTFAAWWTSTTTLLTGGCSSMCLPISTPNRRSASSDDVSWKRGSSVWKKSRKFENGVSENFQVKKKMKIINRQTFERLFYQQENFNFSHFKMKLKFDIFSCLKFCFKISKI